MTAYFKRLSYLALIFMVFSCGTKRATNVNSNVDPNVNTRLNVGYIGSKKEFSGKLTNSQYSELKSVIEKEFKTKIPNGKTILINYSQKAPNCLALGLNANEISTTIDNGVRISSRISSRNNAMDFFVYAKNIFHPDLFLTRKNFKMDSGFFYNDIFTLHENCAAFLIVKPNGSFLKYYGENYFEQAKTFLEKKD